MSLPVRGAWIEIISWAEKPRMFESLPVRGAWIEITSPLLSIVSDTASLPVRGAWIEMSTLILIVVNLLVAPRAGSVD